MTFLPFVKKTHVFAKHKHLLIKKIILFHKKEDIFLKKKQENNYMINENLSFFAEKTHDHLTKNIN